LKVTVLASTALNAQVMYQAYGYDVFGADGSLFLTDADALGEAAGRLCYKSFDRPNPNTARNADYMANILRQGHESVLEHASVTFLVRGVSRALLTELTRHRHLSFSVVSQRYVDYGASEPVIPPALQDDPDAVEYLTDAYADARRAYRVLVAGLTGKGLSRKAAREAARAIMPNAAPVDLVVTGNLRAWRDVIRKRWHVAADAEIREFARLVLVRLRGIAPHSVQDIPADPYGSDEK